MSEGNMLLRLISNISLAFALMLSMTSYAGFLGFGSTSWKEEVLQNDGSKIIVTRSQSRGGSREIGQPPPVKEHTISFTLPNSNKTITWSSEYGDDVGRSNFDLLALHVLNGTSYIVTTPNLCLSYNKWGRPNPPYVFFKYDSKEWKRIPLSEFPSELKSINVAADTLDDEDKLVSLGFVTAEKIKELNNEFRQPEYSSILREPLPNGGQGGCGELIHTNEGWEGLGFFKLQHSYEACMKYCDSKKVAIQECPCTTIFKAK